MKKSTMEAKLAALLGIDPAKAGIKVDDKKGKKGSKSVVNLFEGVSEDEIQDFRAAQGLVYFLQAPELFTAKVCPHCGESFLVSRQYVKFCSYTCIKKDLETKGINWSKGEDIESLVKTVYDGNEPIWIRNLDRIQAVLNSVPAMQLTLEA